jgi:PAS domain S-box-containing protein
MADDLIKPPARVFVLDDEPDICLIIKQALALRSATTVEIFHRLADMLAAENLARVDLFVIDVNLGPDGSGFDVPAKLPARSTFAAFLFISGFPLVPDDSAKCKAIAIYDFIAKPFDLFSFLRRAELLLMARNNIPGDPGDHLDLWVREPFLAVVIDRQYTVRYCNEFAARYLLAGTSADLIGRRWPDFLPVPDAEKTEAGQKNILRGAATEFENDVRRADGSIRAVKWFNSPFIGRDNEPLTLSVGVPVNRRGRSVDDMRNRYRDILIRDRAAIRAIKPLSLATSDVCGPIGGGNP